MTCVLRIWFLVVLATMIAVTCWAGSQVPLWSIPRSVGSHPWFIATLVDTYWAFLAFYLWVWHKEPGAAARGLWLVAILLLGNIAMAVYALGVLYRLPPDASAEQILLRGPRQPLWIPLALLGAGSAVALVAAVG